MLKHKLKQWLIKHEPEACKVEPGSPRSTTPPLKRTPSMSAVNQYPSLKTKVLGPKMEPTSPSEDSSKENGRPDGEKGAYSSAFASTSNLAAAASFATGLPCGKRKADDVPFKPSSPVKTVRVVESEEPESRPTSPKPAPSRSKPPTPKPSRAKPSPKPKPAAGSAGPSSSDATDAGADEPKEETDEEVARRLHQEFNCAPMRTSRSRGAKPCAQEVAEDSVHGQDPGILPSC